MQHCSRSLSHVTLWSRLWPLEPEHTPARALQWGPAPGHRGGQGGCSQSWPVTHSPSITTHKYRPGLCSASSQQTALTTDRTWSAPGALNCLHCTALSCPALHCPALHCTVLHCAPPPQPGRSPAWRQSRSYTLSFLDQLPCTALHRPVQRWLVSLGMPCNGRWPGGR